MEQLADQLFKQDQYEEAFNIYQQCEQTSSILIKQAQLSDKIGLFKQAINYYWQAFDKGEKKNEILIKIGKLQTQLGNYHLAIQVFNQILSVDQNNPIAMGELGYTYYCMEDHMNALSQLKKCSQFISIIPRFLAKLANELHNEYKYYTAKLYFIVAYQIDSNCFEVVYGLIKTLIKLEEYEQSLQYCKSLLEIDPDCIMVKLKMIKISIMTNKIEDAEEIVKILDNRSLDQQEIYQLIELKGLILFKRQQYQDCIDYLTENVKENNHEIELFVIIAKCYYELQRYEEALNQLEMVFDVFQNYYPALELQYKILISINKLDEAELIKQNIYIQFL